MPTRETSGAQPGERSGGAGALPGSNTETAVVIPPDEKAGIAGSQSSTSAPVSQEQPKGQPNKVNCETMLQVL